MNGSRFSSFLLLFSAACGGAGPTASGPRDDANQPSVTVAVDEKGARPFDETWNPALFEPRRLTPTSFVFRLPQARRWRDLPARGPWLGLAADHLHAELWLRHTVARRTVAAEECATEARLSLALLRGGSSPENLGPLLAPDDYSGFVEVQSRGPRSGHVVAFGASTSRCYAAVLSLDDVDDVGGRLAAAARGVLGEVRLLSLDERALGVRTLP